MSRIGLFLLIGVLLWTPVLLGLAIFQYPRFRRWNELFFCLYCVIMLAGYQAFLRNTCAVASVAIVSTLPLTWLLFRALRALPSDQGGS